MTTLPGVEVAPRDTSKSQWDTPPELDEPPDWRTAIEWW